MNDNHVELQTSLMQEGNDYGVSNSSSVTSLHFVFIELSIAIGCLVVFDFVTGVIVGLLLNSAVLILFRKWKAWGVTTLLYGLFLLLLLAASVLDMRLGGPYAYWYNHRLEQLAVGAKLIGKDESSIVPVLGEPTYEYTSWNSVDAETKLPIDGAKLCTTYKYSPYPLLPTIQGFEVHCRNGKVIAIEVFDD